MRYCDYEKLGIHSRLNWIIKNRNSYYYRSKDLVKYLKLKEEVI